MKSKPFVELSGITLRADDRLLFSRTNWVFYRNQNWAIVGSNGSGKTLLARAIGGEIPIVEGEIRYHFRTPAGRLPEDYVRMVSFEQQRAIAGDAPDATRWFSLEQDDAIRVKEFLSQNSVEEINPYEVNPFREQTPKAFSCYRSRILGLLQIKSLLHRTLSNLSNGEMRKVLLARALLRKPRLLILDDVFAGLDQRYRAHLKGLLGKLMRSRSVRILLVNPKRDEMPRGITHILWVDRCRVVAEGSRETMLRDRGVAALFRSVESEKSKFCALRRSRGLQSESRELIRIEGATVQYDGHQILSGINWKVRRGESWALTGPNGSGKSTLLSLISGDNPQAYANPVYVFGRRRGEGESIWAVKKRIGSISSELHLHFPVDQTCIETVVSGLHDSTGCYHRPSTEQRRAAMRTLARLGMLPMAQSPFGSISTGLQRTVLLARALVKSPDLLLLDEPCQGMDVAHRAKFLNFIETLLRRKETTIIYVTHFADEIPKSIKRVLKLDAGRIIESQ